MVEPTRDNLVLTLFLWTGETKTLRREDQLWYPDLLPRLEEEMVSSPLPMCKPQSNKISQLLEVCYLLEGVGKLTDLCKAHGGSYSIYYALAVAAHEIKIDHRPDFTNTEPAANIGPFPQWADKKKIVSMDPLGHLAPWLFKDTIEKENGELSLSS